MTDIALAQYQPTSSPDENLSIIERITAAAETGAFDLLCFSHDFLGPGPDDGRALEFLSGLAARHKFEVLTGRCTLADGRHAQSVLIAPDGAVAGWIPLGVVTTLDTVLGPTMVLSEEQAYKPEIDARAAELRPRAMIMQANAISLLELEAIKELAIERSYNQAHLVICASDVGPCADEICLGVSFAVFQGEILAEADVDATELVGFSVDMAKFLDYDELRDRVVIPELLRKKYDSAN